MVLKVKHDGTDIDVPGTRRGEPLVRAIGQPQIEHESELGLAFSWTSLNTDIAAGSTRLIIRNTDSNFLVLTRISGMPANVSCQYDYGIGQSTTAFSGGTGITAKNLNEAFNTTTFDYDAMDGDTAIADADILGGLWVSTVASNHESLSGVILGKNHFFQVNQETEATSGRITVKGFFIEELQ